MKYFKFVILVLSTFLFVSCENKSNSKSYIDVIDNNIEFTVGDTVPSWEDYFTIVDEESVSQYTVNSDFEFTETFDRHGEFIVQVKLTLKNGDIIYESFTIIVNPNERTVSREQIKPIFDTIENSLYFSYDSTNIVDYTVSSVNKKIEMETKYEQYLNLNNGENSFHTHINYNLPNETYFEETYFTVNEDGLSMVVRDSYLTEWYGYVISLEEILSTDPGFSDKQLFDLLNGTSEFVYKVEGDTVEVEIPLSKANFSLNILSEVVETFYLLGIIDEDFNLADEFENVYHLIDCTLVTDDKYSEIIEIRFDYTEFLNQTFDITDSNLIELSNANQTFNDAVLIYTNISTDSLNIVIPDVEIVDVVNYIPSGNTFIEWDQSIVDAVVDTDNTSIYYTVEGDNYLHKFNYETYEQDQIYFNIHPDQLFYRDNKVYVGLSDGHQYYWKEEEQYGGLGIVDAIMFTKIHEHELSFDPYSIVVDNDGFVYITAGSHQHSSIYSINSNSGQIIDERYGIYYGSKILYSEYTNRIYYVELNTTSDYLEVFEVERGAFGNHVNGDERFDEENLAISPDGKYIYTRDGKVFELSKTLSEDAKITYLTGVQSFFTAFNQEDNLIYSAQNDGIYIIDDEFEVQGIIDYSGYSNEMIYDSGKLINIGSTYMEIIDLQNTEANSIVLVTSANYGDDFNPENYIDSMIAGNVNINHISGEVNTDELGQAEIIYSFSSDIGALQNGTIKLFVNVVDNEAPTVTLPSETIYTIEVGSTFTPPACNVLDNYDLTPLCEVYENNVDSSTIGNYDIIYKATDINGNVTLETFTFEITLPLSVYNTTTYEITGLIGETVYDMTTNSIFYISVNTKEIVKYDLNTETEERISFDYKPERLLMHEGKLYATIVHKDHSSYWWEEDQTGGIAIIDMASFVLESLNDIQVDPYAIAIKDGYLYVVPGSGQWVNMKAYDLSNFNNNAYVCHMNERTFIAYHPDGDYIYGITYGLSPQSLERYDLTGLTCSGGLDDPGHGDYSYGSKIFASPYNDYVFSERGQKFYAIGSTNFIALDYAGDVKFSINSMYFDTTNNITFFGEKSGFVKISYTTDYKVSEEVNIGYTVDQIYGDENSIYVISYSNDKIIFIQAERVEQ